MNTKHFLLSAILLALTVLNVNAQTTTFARGADISWCTEMEADGVKFCNKSGTETDIFALMKQLGMTAIRLRVWVNPKDFGYGAWSDKADVITKAKRAHAQGLDLMIDFHYSDFFTDSGTQTTPIDWKDYTLDQLKTAVANHTTDVLQALKDEGITPKWIQVGNETSNGMLWSKGKIDWDKSGWARFTDYAALSNVGYDAAKAVFSDAIIIVHHDNAYQDLVWFYNGFKAAGGKFDMIGLSHYPDYSKWSSTTSGDVSNPNAENTVKRLIQFNVPVMIVETGYNYYDGTRAKNVMADLFDRMTAIPQCAGIFYWEPQVNGTWKPQYYNTRGWVAYAQGAFKTYNGMYRPTDALDPFQDTNSSGSSENLQTLSIKVIGNGYATYNGTSIREGSQSFSVTESSSATISFTPDAGYRIKSVKVNSTDVTSSVTNNSFTISSISANTILEIEFEIIPLTEFEVNGISYKIRSNTNNVTVCGKNKAYTGAIKIPESVYYQGTVYAVTSIGEDAFYGDNSITSIVIPNTITLIDDDAFGGCDNINTVYISSLESWLKITFGNSRSNPLSGAYHLFIEEKEINDIIIPEGITILDDYVFFGFLGLKTLTLPNSLKALYREFKNCSNLQLVISNIENPSNVELGSDSDPFGNISPEAKLQVPKGVRQAYLSIPKWCDNFKEIVEQTDNYTLFITSIGNGSALYNGTTIRSKSSTFTVNEGTSATISFSPDNGYRIKSVKLNNVDVTSSVTNNQYTISNISTNTTLEVEFEAIGDRPYAVLSNNNTVLRFYYDDQINSRGGMSVLDLGWLQMSSSITTVQFDRTFASYSPTSTAYWFNGMWELTTLDLTNLTMTNVTNTDGMFQNCTMLTTIYVNDTWPAQNGSNVTGTDMFSGCRSLVGSAGTAYDGQYIDYSYAHIDGGVSNPGYFTSNTMYSLSIKATGNGYASYNGTTIRGGSQSFSVTESSSATILFTPDAGCRLKSVKLNNVDVTTNVANSQYTISNINANTTLEVEFEAIPVTTYSLSITATGNGYATYGSTTIRSKTSSFTVNEGTTAQVTFVPDNGYRVAKVLQNDVDVTASVVSNKYTINNISANTTLKVTFEEIPPTTYTLTITTSGNGSVTYENTILQNQTKDFTVTEGTYATLVFTPESGYRVASVKVNWATISPITSNQYTVNDITSNTTVVVTFEPIPVTAYSLSITASGNGSATFNNTTIRNKTQQFSVVEGTNVLVTFSPDNGHSVGSVKVNGADVTNEVAGNSYEIKNFSASTVLEVVFIENVNALTVDGVNYSVTSQTNKTVIVVGGNYGQVLTVPATFTQYGTTWTVTGIETDALKSNSELAAVMWDAEAPFTATVSNPNLLLYVKAIEYANNTIKNVIVNGVASNITLYDASNGNNFCCPKAFLAHHISYTHHYGMITGINEAKGWETIALPFDVQTITHESKGKIVPFATWQETSSEKPFWLYEMTGSGFVKANSIKAQVPYIISMPNNSEYYSEWLLNGNVTFAASEVFVYVTDELQGIQSNGKSFYPCFTNKSSTEGLYALNVSNDYAQNNSGSAEGSRFVLNMRQIHPFEAYMTTDNASRAFIPIFEESTPTDIPAIMMKGDTGSEKWHTMDGLLLQSKPTTKGVYILNDKKVVVK